ncbi:hypothetical protein TrVGV298_008178 [Trichoderma virens]|nr:hypothetical protein TrVGV298_008178 [Trichoderma virens]
MSSPVTDQPATSEAPTVTAPETQAKPSSDPAATETQAKPSRGPASTETQVKPPSGPAATEPNLETAVLEGFKPSKLKEGSDPVLDRVDLSLLIVNPDDDCSFDVNYARTYPVLIKWQEGIFLANKSDTYYVIGFTNKTKETKPKGYLFVAQDKIETFMTAHPLGNFKVTNEFLYGQSNQDGNGRFLVLHDPKRKVYQIRFLEGLLSWVDTAAETLGEIKKMPKQVIDALKLVGSFAPLFGQELKKDFRCQKSHASPSSPHPKADSEVNGM